MIKYLFAFFMCFSFLSSQNRGFLDDYRTVLTHVKDSSLFNPICFISRADEDLTAINQDFIIGSLVKAGVHVICDRPSVVFLGESIVIDDHLPLGSNVQAFMNRIQDVRTEFVLAFYTRKYYERSNDPIPNAGIVQEIELITRRIGQDTHPSFLMGMLIEGNHRESVPIQLSRYLYNSCVDSLGIFNQKKCVLEILILLKDKFYRMPISREINQFIERYYPQNVMVERQNTQQRMIQEVIPSYSISVGRGIGQQTIIGGNVTQTFY